MSLQLETVLAEFLLRRCLELALVASSPDRVATIWHTIRHYRRCSLLSCKQLDVVPVAASATATIAAATAFALNCNPAR